MSSPPESTPQPNQPTTSASTPASTPAPTAPAPSTTANTSSAPVTAAHPPAAHRKRKRQAHQAAASPAPSDPGNPNGVNPPELLFSRADLHSRPILSISRGPNFVPVAESSEYFKTELIGVNRVGYRYVPAGINPPGYAQPCRTIESNPTTYRVSWEDRSPFIKVTKDGLGLAGSKGFRSARCNAPIREGKWYMEIRIVHGGGEKLDDNRREGSHVRLGWGRREAPLNGPVGVDGYSYGFRDKTGEKVTLSRPRPYGRPWHTGDVIGMYISLPPRRRPDEKDPLDPAHLKRERIPIDLKGQEVFEILEYPQSKEMAALMDYGGKPTTSESVPSSSNKKSANAKLPERGPAAPPKPAGAPQLRLLPTLKDSRIAFFVNGECQGVAFEDIYDYLQLRQTQVSQKAKEKKRAREGVKEHRENPFDDGWLGYYPFISLFNDAAVQLNPGPDFKYPPPADIDALLAGDSEKAYEPKRDRTWRPICERYAEFMAEQWALDEVEEQEAKLELQRIAQEDKTEAEKKAARNKKRQVADAKRRATKKAAAVAAASASVAGTATPGSSASGSGLAGRASPAERMLTPLALAIPDDERFGSVGLSHPSPLRQSTAFEGEEETTEQDQDQEREQYNSPAPTFNGEALGERSEYNSEMEESAQSHRYASVTGSGGYNTPAYENQYYHHPQQQLQHQYQQYQNVPVDAMDISEDSQANRTTTTQFIHYDHSHIERAYR